MTAGLACASCFPCAVVSGAAGDPTLFILASIYAILPDTIDFKFYRFFYPHDMTITPDPLQQDPGLIAKAVATIANRVCATGKPLSMKLNTIHLGPDLWQSYAVTFDTVTRQVRVRYGPVVSTGEQVNDSSLDTAKGSSASARLSCDISLDYHATITMASFEGPVITIKPLDDHTVRTEFIPWHRHWSHSFITGLLLAALPGIFLGQRACAIAFVAYSSHILLDQAGFLGSNLFFPFSKKRKPGLKLDHSTGAFTNLAIVWGACLLIFWNLYRFAPGQVPGFNFAKLLVCGLVLPIVAVSLFSRARKSTSG